MMSLNIRRAQGADYERVARLLESASLPTSGVAEHLDNFLIAEHASGIVGAMGLEVYDDVGLLRSAAVDASFQHRGIGSKLYGAVLERAEMLRIRKLILLTTTAAEYFGKKGFRTIDRKSLSGPVAQSVEFTGACPDHAVCMELLLKG